jgi:hypothetical protein
VGTLAQPVCHCKCTRCNRDRCGRFLRIPHASGRTCSVDRLSQAAEPRLGLGQPLHDGQHIGQGGTRAGRASTPPARRPYEASPGAGAVRAGPGARQTPSRVRCARSPPPRGRPPARQFPGRWWRRERSRAALRKGIANIFDKATAFCTAPTRVNRAPGYSLHKRPFVQASDSSKFEALAPPSHYRFGHLVAGVDFENPLDFDQFRLTIGLSPLTYSLTCATLN